MQRQSFPLWAVFALIASLAASCASAAAPEAGPDYVASVAAPGFDAPLEIRRSNGRTRIDIASGPLLQSFILDPQRGSLIAMTVAGQKRIAYILPLAAAETGPIGLPFQVDQLTARAKTNFVGVSTVAGKMCRLMHFNGYLGRSGTACVSFEGVILQLTLDGRATPLLEVKSITFTKQDPRWFAPSPDFQLTTLPGVGGAPPVRGQG